MQKFRTNYNVNADSLLTFSSYDATKVGAGKKN